MPKTDLLQGTLDLLILKILALAPNHGWDISNRIRQISREGLSTSQGSLYPALHRMEEAGWITASWTVTENKRRARIYQMTRAGKKQLAAESDRWTNFSAGVARVLRHA